MADGRARSQKAVIGMTGFRRHVTLYLFIICTAGSFITSVVLIVSLILYLQGGSKYLFDAWRSNQPGEFWIAWVSIIFGAPIGITLGFRLWRWLVLKLSLVTNEEFDRLVTGSDGRKA